ncbi:MAG TPA: hypothetical protein VJU18_04610 [Vicinamibacteria bacterium]|nr:hypothetical protein [Vicinamibacteria bacterium]
MKRRSSLLALGLYALLLFPSFYPVSRRPWDTVAYVGDSLESAYIVAWNVRQFFRAPAHLFDANILHPLGQALAFTDHRLLPSLLVAPVMWATNNPVLAANVAVALGCLLAAMGARHLGRVLGLGLLGSWVAGALYGFHTYQINEAPRLNIVFHGFIPLALAELVGWLRTGTRRHAWALGGFLLLQGLSSNYHLLYALLLLGLVTLGALVARPRQVVRRLPLAALTASLAGLLLLPMMAPYLRLARSHRLSRELPAGVDLNHYLTTAPGNLVYGAIGAEARLQQQAPHFVGFLALGLALAALCAWGLRRRETDSASGLAPRIWVPTAAAVGLLFVVLSLGADMRAFGLRLGPGPYRLLYDWIPGFRLVRIPERLGLLAMLFLGLLAGRGLDLLASPGRRWLALGLAILVPAEHFSVILHTDRVPTLSRSPAVYRWLAENPAGAVVELPIRGEALVRRETLEMYFSAVHWRPLVHGYTAYPPLVSRLLRRLAAEFPSPASLVALRRVGVETVVVHQGRPLGKDLVERPDVKAASTEEQARRLQRADLDLYDRLPRAVARGYLLPRARFEGPGARLFEATADEVYSLAGAPPVAVARFPAGNRRRDPLWRYAAKRGQAADAADANLSTAWSVPRRLQGDEYFEVLFDRPLAVAGVVLPLRRDSAFPTRFRVAARDPSGNWTEVSRYDGPHALQLLDRVLADPAHAALGFDLGGRVMAGVRLLVDESGTSEDGWRLPEVEIWVR